MRVQRLLLCGLVLILFLAPLRFGAVEDGASAALVGACLLLGILWLFWRGRRGLSLLPWKDPVLVGGGLFVGFALFQILPLPRPLLEGASPKAVELRDRYEPAETSSPDPGESGPGRGSDWRPISLYPWATRQAVLKFIAYLVVALIAVDLAALDPPRRFLTLGLVASGGFQAIYGLAEFFSGRQQIFGYSKRFYTDVATGTFINRNHYAGYLEMILPLAVALAAGSFARLPFARGEPLARRLAKVSGRHLFHTAVLFLLALTMATALACSGSRMGIASCLLSLLCVGLYLAWRGRGRSFAAAAAVLAGATVLIFAGAGAGSTVLDRFRAAPAHMSGDLGRWSMWTQAAAMAAAFPRFGAGLGAFPHVFPAFRTGGEGVALSHAHNDYLELAAEAGVAGYLVLILGVLLVAPSLRRERTGPSRPDLLGSAATAGLLAIGFHSLSDFNLAIPSNALTLAVLAGIWIHWRRASHPVLAVDNRTARPRVGRALALASVFVTIAAVAVAPVVGQGRNASAGESPVESGAPMTLSGEGPFSLVEVIHWGNAERSFQASTAVAGGALRDLQVLLQVEARGEVPSPVAAGYLEGRFREAIRLQKAGLRHLPTSGRGHLVLAYLELNRCAAANLGPDEEIDCGAEVMPEVRAASRLNPTGAALHAAAARFLLPLWPALEPRDRREAGVILEKAAALNREDRDLQEEWRAIRAIETEEGS